MSKDQFNTKYDMYNNNHNTQEIGYQDDLKKLNMRNP